MSVDATNEHQQLTTRRLQKASEIARLASKGWVSLAEFARIINIAYPTALRYKDKGYIVTLKVGGVHRVTMEEVRRFITEGNFTGDRSDDAT